MSTKRGVAVGTPWTSDAPAIACEREFRVVGDGEQFMMRLVDVPIEFELDRPRFDHGELIGQLTVRTDLTGARTFQGVLSVGTLNCSSPTARKTRANQLAELACAPQIDFLRLVEEFAIRVHTAMRTGGE
ncbi:MAG TPA: hypothetical protein VNJ04_14320, partial [Gemmatimonadaceae bacterium]|nr:hypothetical protein [Gemmatimonadaceae bacterium]HXG71780.1 hypothetical protein [Gemmatimonadaceae bacterium]